VLEQELVNYSCLTKGDTININYQGRDYMINVVECKPTDNICVVEADIEVDFDQPLDYKEVMPKIQKNNSHFAINNEENKQKLEEMSKNLTRLDGKPLTEK
jgi:ubiquitin fusion degradation protein 1